MFGADPVSLTMLAKQSFFESRWMRLLLAVAAVLAGAMIAMLNAQFGNPLKVLIIIVGMFAALATVWRVEWGLLAFVFMSYTRFSDVMVSNGAPSTAQPFLALLFLIIFMRWMMYGEKPANWLTAAALIVIYGLVGVASFLYADDVVRVKYGVTSYFKDAVIVVVIVMLLRTHETLRRTIWMLLAAGIFMASITTFQQLTGTFDNDYYGFAKAGRMQIIEGQEDDYRISGPIGDPNFYSQVLLALVPMGIERLWNERNKKLRWLAIWMLLVCIASIIFTASRGAFVAMLIGIGIMFLRRPPKPITVIAAVIGLILVIPLLPPGYTARLKTIPDAIPGLSTKDVRTEASFRGRSSAQQAGIRMFLANPLFGLGVGNYGNHYQEYARDLGLDSSRWDQAPHNTYLEILTEKGLFGLAIFTWMMWVIFRGMKRARTIFRDNGMPDYDDLVYGFQAGLIGYMFAAIFLQMSYPRFFWVLIGIGFAIPNVAQKIIDLRQNNQLSLGQRIQQDFAPDREVVHVG